MRRSKAYEIIHFECNQNEITFFETAKMGPHSYSLNQTFRSYLCQDIKETLPLNNLNYQIKEETQLRIQLDETFKLLNRSPIDFSNTIVVESPIDISKLTLLNHQSHFFIILCNNGHSFFH